MGEALDTLAQEIRANYEKLDLARREIERAQMDIKDLRLTLARQLLAAKHRVEAGEAGETGWKDWVEANIKRSFRDVQKLIAMAKTADPAAAREQEKANNRAAAAKSRANKKVADVSRARAAASHVAERRAKQQRPALQRDERALVPYVKWISGWKTVTEVFVGLDENTRKSFARKARDEVAGAAEVAQAVAALS